MRESIYYVHKEFNTVVSCEKLHNLLEEGRERITFKVLLPFGKVETKSYVIRDIPFNHDFDTIVLPKLKDYQLVTLINSVGLDYTLSKEEVAQVREPLIKNLELIHKLKFRGVDFNE